MPMGLFRVTEVRSDEYYAKGVRNIDPLWMGHLRKRQETSLLPSMVAFHIPHQEGSNGH
jgi:hypothetical protein